MPPSTHLILATGNPHKVQEMRQLFRAVGLDGFGLFGLADTESPPGGFVEPAESGTTFEANARIKALSYARQTGDLCLADDSGLEVDALHGAPGVISSHYSTGGRETGLTRGQRDAANNALVLQQLDGVPPERRTARFVCVMALAGLIYRPESHGDAPFDPFNLESHEAVILHITRGTFEGRIGLPGEVPRGDNGFGYDPLFLVAPDFTRTSAELSSDEKNRLSHRGAALRAMAEYLRGMRG